MTQNTNTNKVKNLIVRSDFIVSVILAVVIAEQASAFDCGDDPNNLLMAANCDFDSDIVGFTPDGITSAQHTAFDGHPETGALELSAAIAIPNIPITVESPCVTALPSTSYSCGGYVRITNGSASQCEINVLHYSGPACGSTVGADPGGTISPPTSDWSLLFSANCDTNASTGSLRFVATCNINEANTTVLFDNFFVGGGLTVPVVLQSFSID